MHVWCIDSLYTTSEQLGSKVKGKEHGGVDGGIKCVGCHNQQKNEEMQTQFGNFAELVPFEVMRGNLQPLGKRIETVVLYTHTLVLSRKKHQLELIARKPCCKCTYDKSRIPKIIDFEVLDTDPKELIYYISCVAAYGFDHIIIVGETDYGMICLDCYGRVFQLDDESQFFVAIEDSSKKRKKIQLMEMS
ncbi:unnamed protein product [Rhizophagus irregularis]|uniref:Uncharacterized protein n=1 Tax=Rhizophagus irregularis TaxID=588596 RepID=A0A915YW14_9GLOM|nr:unnamed protein product [Rhizophagus irregularis]